MDLKKERRIKEQKEIQEYRDKIRMENEKYNKTEKVKCESKRDKQKELQNFLLEQIVCSIDELICLLYIKKIIRFRKKKRIQI